MRGTAHHFQSIPKRGCAGLDAGKVVRSIGRLVVCREREYGCSVPSPILGVAVGKGPCGALGVAAAGQIPPFVLPRTGRIRGKVAVIYAIFILIAKNKHSTIAGIW